jgi:hypothetical protein
MKYKTILMILRIFDNQKDPKSETWLAEVLDRYTKYQLRKLGLKDN